MSSAFQSNGRPLLQWLAIAVLVLVSPLFFVGGPGWSDGELYKASWNLGHILFFGLLTFVIRPWRLLTGWKLWAAATLTIGLVGLLIEWLQSFHGRDVDPADALRNLVGLWVVLAFAPNAGLDSRQKGVTWPLRLAALSFFLFEFGTVGKVAIQQWHVSQLPPQLYDFEHPYPGRFWDGNLASGTVETCGPDGKNALLIRLSTKQYSGASLHNLPQNWQGYSEVHLAFWNPEESKLTITIRINDWQHEKHAGAYSDRFNRRFTLAPGRTELRIPLEDVANAPSDRSMDMDDIRRLLVFTTQLPDRRQLCLLNLELANPQ